MEPAASSSLQAPMSWWWWWCRWGVALLLLAWVVNAAAASLQRVWWTPRRLERMLRQQGIAGSPYRLLFGDVRDQTRLIREVTSNPMPLSHDIAPRGYPALHQTMETYGKISFHWLGPYLRLIVNDPDLVREILSSKFGHYAKTKLLPLGELLVSGLVDHEGEKWAKHRRIINPAFHVEKLKLMLPAFSACCTELITGWEKLIGPDGSFELNIFVELQNFTGDVISRTAFGSSYEEGRQIFQLQAELQHLILEDIQNMVIPCYGLLPTKRNRRMRKIAKEVRTILRNMIMKREKEMEMGTARYDDLLNILLDSNLRHWKEDGNSENFKMTTEDVVEECKLFYFAGQETTSILLTWTMVLLSMNASWQARARDEVLRVFSKNKPDFDGLSQLKIVTMILYEVLRLYPPVPALFRSTYKKIRLGKFTLPPGVHLILPLLSIHQDPTIWGEDAMEFKPERFSEGISKASKHQMAFFPFSQGPRICIGQSFAMVEAKMGLATILQHFSFELSPSYKHAPRTVLTLQPQYGAQLILHKL